MYRCPCPAVLSGFYYVDLRAVHLLHNPGMAHVVLARTEEDLVARFRIACVELPLVPVVAQGIGASRSRGLLRLAQKAQRILIAESSKGSHTDNADSPLRAF